jgi:hypothetical protein
VPGALTPRPIAGKLSTTAANGEAAIIHIEFHAGKSSAQSDDARREFIVWVVALVLLSVVAGVLTAAALALTHAG